MNTPPTPPALGPRANPILLPILTALGTTHAFDIGSLLVLWDDHVVGKATQETYQTEAGLLVMAVGLAFVVLLKLRRASQQQDTEAIQDCATLVIVAVVGGFFAILSKTKADDGSFTDQTLRSLYFFVVISLILLTPFVRATWDAVGLRRYGQITRGMMQVIFIAMVPTALLQLLYKYLGDLPLGVLNDALSGGTAGFGGNGFYISAPAVAALFAAWAFLSVHPIARPTLWGFSRPVFWAAGYLGLGLLLIAGFVGMIYLPSHTADAWLHGLEGAAGFWRAFAVFLSLQLPPLVLPMIAVLAPLPPLNTWVWAAVAFLVGGLSSGAIITGLSVPVAFGYSSAQCLAFAFAHALAAGATTLAVLMVLRQGAEEPKQSGA